MCFALVFLIWKKAKNSRSGRTRGAAWSVPARSEKIRTYNYPQDRITDHRINYNQHNLPAFMMGAMDDMLDALNVYAKEEQLKAAGGTD